METVEIFQENLVEDTKLKQALASLRLEGITLSKEALEDVQLVAEGKMKSQDALARELARVRA
jgi:hypothetical protein